MRTTDMNTQTPDPEPSAKEQRLEPDGGNLYRPHKLMIHSGQFWRCKHGRTGFGEGLVFDECEDCKSDDPAAYAKFTGKSSTTHPTMTSEMPTPRTDAEKTRSWEKRRKEHYTSEARAGHSNDGWKFAEQLERDLSTLRKAAEAARVFIAESACAHCDGSGKTDINGEPYDCLSCPEREQILASLRSELSKP